MGIELQIVSPDEGDHQCAKAGQGGDERREREAQGAADREVGDARDQTGVGAGRGWCLVWYVFGQGWFWSGFQ